MKKLSVKKKIAAILLAVTAILALAGVARHGFIKKRLNIRVGKPRKGVFE